MKVITVAILVVLMVLSSVALYAFQNEPEGFRGLKWGDPLAGNMEYYTDTSNMKVYIIPGDKMGLGDVSLWMICYIFYEGQFASVALYYDGEKNYKLLQTICKERYGKQELKKGFYKLDWKSQRSFIHLKYDYIDEDGFLLLSSTPLAAESIRAENKENTAKAEGDW